MTYQNDPFQLLKSFGLGYDTVLRQMEQAKDILGNFKNVGYPPFNVKKAADNHYTIELAVAGFGKNSLDIETADGILSITGKIEGDTEGADYLYKGIADRAFTRKFVLADTMEIKNAELINGMLKIYLENLIPESKKPRKVSINDEPITDAVSAVTSWFSPKEKEVA